MWRGSPTQGSGDGPAQEEPVQATGRWLSARPVWSGPDMSRLHLEITSANEPQADNGRAFWNFLIERILLAEYDEAERQIAFLMRNSGPFVIGKISEDDRSMHARFAGAPTFGALTLDGLVGDTLTFTR